jgi:hypothetical protein
MLGVGRTHAGNVIQNQQKNRSNSSLFETPRLLQTSKKQAQTIRSVVPPVPSRFCVPVAGPPVQETLEANRFGDSARYPGTLIIQNWIRQQFGTFLARIAYTEFGETWSTNLI